MTLTISILKKSTVKLGRDHHSALLPETNWPGGAKNTPDHGGNGPGPAGQS